MLDIQQLFDLNMTSSEEANFASIETIAWLQKRFLPYEWWIVQTSVIGDNREAFFFYFPFITGLMNILGVKVLWAAIFSEWLNLNLKWIFKGDRPYWWIYESSMYTTNTRPILKQFHNTCETGPGTPSGHLMMNVAIFYVLVRGLAKNFIWNPRRYRFTNFLITLFVYSLYIIWIGLITISRLYIQTHFIHQCFFGIIFGIFIGHMVWRSKWLIRPGNIGSIFFCGTLAGSAVLMYILLWKNGLDPLWSIPLATKYCSKIEYVSLDTQPFYTIVRYSASALGLGLALGTKGRKIAQSTPRSTLRTILSIKVGLLFGRLISLAQKNLPIDDMMLYYSASFALQMILPYVVVAVIPYLLFGVYPPKRGNHK